MRAAMLSSSHSFMEYTEMTLTACLPNILVSRQRICNVLVFILWLFIWMLHVQGS